MKPVIRSYPNLYLEQKTARSLASQKKILYLGGISSNNFKSNMICFRGGFQIHSPNFWGMFFSMDKNIAQKAVDEYQPDVIVGSSRGGALAMNIDTHEIPLVLLAPAWKYFGKASTLDKTTYILHSKKDELIPYEHSRELLNNKVTLFNVGKSHTLSDFKSIDFLIELLYYICDIDFPRINLADTVEY